MPADRLNLVRDISKLSGKFVQGQSLEQAARGATVEELLPLIAQVVRAEDYNLRLRAVLPHPAHHFAARSGPSLEVGDDNLRLPVMRELRSPNRVRRMRDDSKACYA